MHYRLNGRLAKLEQQTVVAVDYAHMPAAQRQARIAALLRKHGVSADTVDATRTRLQGMSTAERQAWLKKPFRG